MAQPPVEPEPWASPPDWSQSESPMPAEPPRPRELGWVVNLLLVNLAVSIALTVVTVLARRSLVSYQLDHRHISDPAQRALLQHSYAAAIVGRVVGNIVVSVVYVFLVRALLRGRRWAYRRVIWIGSAGIVALLLAQLTPYPWWIRMEQLLQAAVLAALVWCVRRPPVRDYYASHLPGRTTRRFRR